jgi:hypothetical protein
MSNENISDQELSKLSIGFYVDILETMNYDKNEFIKTTGGTDSQICWELKNHIINNTEFYLSLHKKNLTEQHFQLILVFINSIEKININKNSDFFKNNEWELAKKLAKEILQKVFGRVV